MVIGSGLGLDVYCGFRSSSMSLQCKWLRDIFCCLLESHNISL